MNSSLFKELMVMTIRDPRQAGREIIALGYPVQGLWIALMLMAVLLSLLVSGIFQISPMPEDEIGQIMQLSPAYHSPLIFAIINWGQLVITVFVLHWVGSMMGGQGSLRDMLSVMVWLQVISLVLAVSIFVISMALPLVGGLGMLLALFWGIWATVALVDAAHRFDNMFKSFGACVIAVVAFSIGMTLISAVIGGIAYRGA